MNHLKAATLKPAQRVASASFLAAIGAGVLFLSSLPADARPGKFDLPKSSPATIEQLQAALKKPIAKASIAEIEGVLKAAVAAHPEEAPNYVAAIFQSDRKRVCPESARIVAAALEALGKKAPAELIFAVVRTSIILDEECASMIVKAAIRSAPRSLAYKIVGVAVASLQHPGEFVRDGKQLSRMTMAEALANSVLEEFPDLDPALVNSAANGALIASNSPLGNGGILLDNPPIFNTEGGGTQVNNPNPNEPESL